MYLIVIEAEGAGDAFHYQPYRLAATVDEARELMFDYLRAASAENADGFPENPGALTPQYFALYQERGGEFGRVEFYDPLTPNLDKLDSTEWMKWLQQTGRL
jgi:hypothetical protein